MGKANTHQYDYDLIVIGSGAGGSVAAHLANKAGLAVAIVEADLIGGECPNVGCVPTKALLEAAGLYWAVKHGNQFGIRGSTVGYNYPSIKAWKDLAVKRTGTYLGEEMYTEEGINVIHGRAHFVDPHTISVGVARFTAHKFVIASGSKLKAPPIPGLDSAGYLTYKEAINLTRPPRSLAIIGGGAIGCEFARLFASFGSRVQLIEAGDRLLNKEEPEASVVIENSFSDQFKVSVQTKTQVLSIKKVGLKRYLSVRRGKQIATSIVDEILLATGKAGAVDMGLENAGVTSKNGFITVNQHLQTSAPHIFAAGDCIGPQLFTHLATYQSRIVAHNLLHPRNLHSVDYRAIPRCIFTDPELAAVGPTEAELKQRGRSYQAALVNLSVIGRANTANAMNGFVKVLAQPRTGRLLGGTVVSPHAGEVIHELTLAVQQGLTAQQIAETVHAFPSWSEALRVACNKLVRHS